MNRTLPGLPRPLMARIFQWRNWSLATRTMVLASLLGLATGLMSALLTWGMRDLADPVFNRILKIMGPGMDTSWPWMILILPALGGGLAGWLCQRFAPESAGGGTDVVVRAFHDQEGRLRGRNVPLKLAATVLTVGSGGSGGMEGPVIQIGATLGSWISQKLRLLPEQRRTLLIAGAAAGVGSIFRSPMGGALFACEMVYSRPEIEGDAVVPSLIASVGAYSVFGMFWGFEPILKLDAIPQLDASTFLILTLLAFCSVLAARVYARFMSWVQVRLGVLPLGRRAAVGGLLAGTVGFLGWILISQFNLAHDANLTLGCLRESYGALSWVTLHLMTAPVSLLLILFLGKFFSSAFTIGSGGSAGAFAPSMVLGGTLGGIVWRLAAALGYTQVTPAAFVLAGMSGFFSAAFRSPLSSVLIIIAVAQGYHLLPALMWVAAIGYLLGPDPCVIHGQVWSREDSPAHRGLGRETAFGERVVGQSMRPMEREVAFEPLVDLEQIRKTLATTRQDFFPVRSEEGKYLGGFFWDTVPAALAGQTAGDLMSREVATLDPGETLEEALRRMTGAQRDELPVLSQDGRILGLLNRRDLFREFPFQVPPAEGQ